MKATAGYISLWLLILSANSFGAVVERITGTLEKTVKTGACAQITDVLHETYYVVKTSQAEKKCKALLGKKVVLSGVVEERAFDHSYFFNLRAVKLYSKKSVTKSTKIEPKLDANAPLPPAKKSDEKKKPQKKSDAKAKSEPKSKSK